MGVQLFLVSSYVSLKWFHTKLRYKYLISYCGENGFPWNSSYDKVRVFIWLVFNLYENKHFNALKDWTNLSWELNTLFVWMNKFYVQIGEKMRSTPHVWIVQMEISMILNESVILFSLLYRIHFISNTFTVVSFSSE